MLQKRKPTDNFRIDGVYTLILRSVENGYLYPGETHDFWEMMYCSKGSAIVCTGEEILEFGCDQVIFFKPMQFHSFRIEEEEGSEFFITAFDMKGELCESLADKIFKVNQNNAKNIKEIINYLASVASISRIEKYNKNICEVIANVPYAVNVVINMLENFIIFLLNESEFSLMIVKTHDAKIYSFALTTIDNAIGRKITVREIAKACNVGQTYLKALFKKYNGLGIHEYILKIKIGLAKQMLAEGKTVNEIYEKLGFTTQSYMSTAFKRETGMSPLEYKNYLNRE